jgi:DNA-binding protein H-NS
MKEYDFSLFTDRQLEHLEEQVQLEFARRSEEAERLVRKRGGLVEGAGPRYRNPDNPAETWSGKGKRPAWLEAALAAGKTLESLEIADDRPVTKGLPSRPEGT